MSEFSLGYSQEIKQPATKKEGLLNFVQMIINAAERGDVRNAILLAVDLKDAISGNANPYSDITDGLTQDAVAREVADARASMERLKAEAVAKAFRDGAAQARAEMLKRLQEAA